MMGPEQWSTTHRAKTKERSSALFASGFLVFSLFYSQTAHSAACCGGGGASGTLITGDSQSQLSAVVSSQRAIIEKYLGRESIIYHSKIRHDQTHSLGLAGSILLSDRWQVGAQTQVQWREVMRSQQEKSAQGWGDSSASLGFEFLPEYFYSEYKPRGHVYLSLAVATGLSIYESRSLWAEDVTSAGNHSLAVGIIFTKIFGNLDLSTSLESGLHFARTFAGVGVDIPPTSLDSRKFFNGNLSVGYSPFSSNFRLGSSLGAQWAGARVITSEDFANIQPARILFPLTFELSWLFSPTSSLGLGYRDETVLSTFADNSTFGRSLLVSFTQRWNR
jgi:hypothetical protein